MKYIIMCGGSYEHWPQPKQLTRINGEPIIERTIRLLRENGVEDIAISSNNDVFKQFGVPVLKHDNSFHVDKWGIVGFWCDAFYPTEEPVCYIFGDVIFSPEAIKTIVETETTRIQLFASAPPFAPEYPKPWAEPFALKVGNTDLLKSAIHALKYWNDQGVYNRHPIVWELWTLICGQEFNTIDYESYVAINDYTCDIDNQDEATMIESIIP